MLETVNMLGWSGACLRHLRQFWGGVNLAEKEFLDRFMTEVESGISYHEVREEHEV